jgi:hypothetical protein
MIMEKRRVGKDVAGVSKRWTESVTNSRGMRGVAGVKPALPTIPPDAE